MATKKTTKPKPEDKVLDKPREEHSVTYIPFGEREEIDLTIRQVRDFLSAKTRKGKTPSERDIIQFMKLCMHRELNPWVKDAYLIGYDNQDGTASFTLITAIQALEKRAEANPNFNGIESGVIVRERESKEIVFRKGDITFDGEVLIGGWAKVFRKDRDKPFYQALDVKTYDTSKSRWNKDKAGMIVKCAEAGAYRTAFPTQLGHLYTQEEEGAIMRDGELPDMPDGRQPFGFSGDKQIAGAEPVVDTTAEEIKKEPMEVMEEARQRAVDRAESSAKPAAQEEPEPGASQNPEPEVEKTANGAQDLADSRLGDAVKHVEKALSLPPNEAKELVQEWLERLGYWPPLQLADDRVWEKVVWPRCIDKWPVS